MRQPPWGLLLIWTPHQMPLPTFFNYAQAGERGPREGQNIEFGKSRQKRMILKKGLGNQL